MLNSATTTSLPGPPHFVDLHVNQGESVSIQYFDGNETVLRGPTTIKMISQHAYPPMPIPVQVPPGHMIQQIVDENGTLRHIILSALNGNNSSFVTQQQTQQPSTFPYCCCCNNICSSGSNTQSSVTSQIANQHIQPQMNHSPMSFPLNHSYTRNRRSNRNYSSPNTKRTNYYNTSHVAKVNRFKSDNPKNGYYNRYSTNLHYEMNRPYDSTNENKFYLNKTYDYSCNSSNASQTSTVDQVNDNLKYYKDDNYSIEDDYTKKSYDTSNFNSNAGLKDCCIEFNQEEDNSTNEAENLSQKSSLSESVENNSHEYSSLTLKKYDVNCNSIKQSKFTNDQRDSSKYSEKLTHKVDNSATIRQSNNIDNDFGSTEKHEVSHKDKQVDKSAKMELSLDTNVNIAQDSLSTASVGESNSEMVDNEISQQLRPDKGDKVEELTCSKVEERQTMSAPKSDSVGSIANGVIEHYLSVVDSTLNYQIENPSEKTDSDSDSDKENDMCHEFVSSVQRSPKHLLPKIEAINLTYSLLSSGSVRLKWFFTQPTEHYEHKKHFIVDMLLNKAEDSPNTRTVHQSHTNSCRISHLQPQKEYTFRVRTSTEDAVLVSNLLTVVTPEHTLNGTKATTRKGRQQSQQFQQATNYHQHNHHHQQTHQSLHSESANEATSEQSSDQSLLFSRGLNSDQSYALIILFGFTFFALVVAVLIQNLLSVN